MLNSGGLTSANCTRACKSCGGRKAGLRESGDRDWGPGVDVVKEWDGKIGKMRISRLENWRQGGKSSFTTGSIKVIKSIYQLIPSLHLLQLEQPLFAAQEDLEDMDLQ